MVAGLEELATACAKQSVPTDAERITEGEPRWFGGYPVAAAPGTIALAQVASLKLVFRVEDILEVHRWHERYVVKVKSDADLLVSMENVIKAGPSGGCCGGGNTGKLEGAARLAVQDPPGDDDWDVLLNKYWGGCLWDIECFTVNLPLVGPIRLCIPTDVRCN